MYANPLFYLREEVPEVDPSRPSNKSAPVPAPSPTPRLMLRLADSARNLPAFLRMWNRQRESQAIVSDHSDGWQFKSVPTDRLDAYEAQLTELCEQIRRDGATPILVTFALRTTSISQPQDEFFFVDMQTHFPRSTPAVLGEFADEANERVRTLTDRLDIPLVDAARKLTGQRELFADLVHFNDGGAKAMADLLFDDLTTLFQAQSATADSP